MRQNELAAEQKSFVKKIVIDPVLFATHVMGVDLWEPEAEILKSIKSHRRTAVKACHGVGKTFTIVLAALWWLARYPEGIVLNDLAHSAPGADPSSGLKSIGSSNAREFRIRN